MIDAASGRAGQAALTAIIDVGKTRSKLVILGKDGSIEYTAEQSSKALLADPYPHLDTNGTWEWMLQALSDSTVGTRVTDCIVVTHGATFALLDGQQLAVPVMDYEFDGYDSINEEYERARDDFGLTCSPSLPAGLNAGRQIFFTQKLLPEKFERVSNIVPYPQFWASRFCGVVASEATSLGSHTDLWRPAMRQYSSLAVGQGWVQRMPPLQPAWTVLGLVLPDVASKSGLNPECRVFCGVHDSNASYLRHLASEQSRFCVVSTGTWVVCMAGGHDLRHLVPERDMLANVDVFGNPVPCARFMGGREFAALTTNIGEGDIAMVADAERLMSEARFALPAFVDSGGPFPSRIGRVVNPTSDVVLQSALASLYCALVTDICLDNLDATGDLIVEGRFVNDAIFVEALSHFRPHQPLRVSDDETGTVHGAARLVDWPNEATALPPVHEAAGPADIYIQYRNNWRNLLTA